MKFFVISDNADAVTGMRLAGIEGRVVQDIASASDALNAAVHDEDIAVVLMTSGAYAMCAQRANAIKQSGSRPLLVEIPDSEGSGVGESIARYVREAVGIKI